MTNEEIVEQIQNGVDVVANQERLIKQNKGYVNMVVRRFCGFDQNHPDFDDYLQEGYIGLLTAAMKYKKDGGANFLTFAAYLINGAISRYFENCSGSVRIPASMRARIRKYQRFHKQYVDEHGKEPDRGEIIEALHLSQKAVVHLEKTIRNMQTASLDSNTKDGEGDPLLEFLQSDEDIEGLITQSVYSKELRKTLDDALSILDQRTRTAIQSVYYHRNSMRETAELLGCTKQMVSDRIHRGFYKILQSRYRKELETFMWDGFEYNIYAYSECSDEVYGYTDVAVEDADRERIETEDNNFLV